MAKSASAAAHRPLKAPPKPPEKAPEKTAAKPVPVAAGKAAPAAAGKPPAKPPSEKPGDKDPKGAKPAALPDAALLDDEAGDGEAAAPAPRRGLAAWLPAGRKRWFVLGAGASGLVAMIAVAAYAASHLFAPPPPPPAEPTTISGPANAVDGATLTVNGRTVRLENIDAPPATLTCQQGAWKFSCGAEARRALDEAIGNAPVECVNPHPDPAGRLAALCRNDTGLDLAAIQVESGWAVNDMRASSRYVAEESRADNGGKGLWRNDFAHPELWHDAPAKDSKDSLARPR